MGKRILCLLLAVTLLCGGCSAPIAQEPGAATTVPTPTPGPTPTTAITPDPEPTQTFPAVTLPAVEQGTIQSAPGTVTFHMGDFQIWCGCPVASLLEQDVRVDGDVEALVPAMGYSEDVRLNFPDDQGKYENYLFFVAVNPTQDPLPVKDCLVYSLAVTFQPGLGFSLGEGQFLTGASTREEILAAWGTPTVDTQSLDYTELVYYRPFSMLQVILYQGVTVQVRAYHSAWLYPELTQAAYGDYTSGDAWAHLSRFMDVSGYAAGEKGPMTDLPLTIQVDGKDIALGYGTAKLPQPWRGLYQYTRTRLDYRRYVYVQLAGREGFTFANVAHESRIQFLYSTIIKGFHGFNPDYTCWGESIPTAYGFSYNGFDHTQSIAQVLAAMGAPREVICESGVSWCFVWLHYESKNGDTLRIKADPISGQLIELRLEQFIPDVIPY